MSLVFTWDSEKAQQNIRKHSVSFEEASTIFGDIYSITFYDVDHSDNEDRYIIVGMSARGRLLMAAFTDRADIIRIISARRATRSEKGYYDEQRG